MADFINLRSEYDSQGMYDKIVEFPDQFEEGYKIGKEADLPDINPDSIDSIIVCGLGGSAIGGDLVRSYLTYKIKVPFHIIRHYNLPKFVNKKSLCIISSYSGNTEETLSAYDEARQAGAEIFAITSNGKLKEKAEQDGFKAVSIPGGFPPRAALGYSFVPMLMILSRLGFFEDISRQVEETVKFLSKNVVQYQIDKEDNPAMKASENLYGRLALIYAGQDHFDAVAVRFKGQICENAKVPAFFNFFPEFNHNELVGWGLVEDFKDKLLTFIIRDEGDHDRVSVRMNIVRRIIEDKDVPVIEVKSSGPNLLARMFSVIQYGDFVSLYLALLNKIDPTPVEVIDFLKSELDKL